MAATASCSATAKALREVDPIDGATDIDPMARPDLRDDLHEQVQASIKSGAKLLLGGQPAKGAGDYYKASVLADVKPGMVAFDDEMFGPDAALCVARDADPAIELANASQ